MSNTESIYYSPEQLEQRFSKLNDEIMYDLIYRQYDNAYYIFSGEYTATLEDYRLCTGKGLDVKNFISTNFKYISSFFKKSTV